MTQVSGRPDLKCLVHVLHDRSQQPIERSKWRLHKRAANEFGVAPDTLAEQFRYWLPDDGPQFELTVVPRTDGTTAVMTDIGWAGPDHSPDRVASYVAEQQAVEQQLATQCGVHFDHATQKRAGDDVKAYFAKRNAS
ncbi:hypothetical protein GCM10023219_11750 [Stakelama sediminis]|uniref:Uncharacterized protein n=1 Tax=Stakelama sediminis TaxID=463200 RepID=A0A840YWH2_9SPHN|nr:hypothetical protein [Stakelama sediminis]MBB5717899.1 hypothetical protein [Stakelama sediminis]